MVLASLANLTVFQPDLKTTSAIPEPDNVTNDVAMASSCC